MHEHAPLGLVGAGCLRSGDRLARLARLSAYHISLALVSYAVLISIGLLAAGISTLEGILLALSTIVSADLFLGLFGNRVAARVGEQRRDRAALWVGRGSIVVLGIVTWLLSLSQIEDPAGGSVAIFAQFGVYLVIAASFVPLAVGMFMPASARAEAGAGALAAVSVYLVAWFIRLGSMSNNPAYLATLAITAGWLAFAVVHLVMRAHRMRMRRLVPGSSVS